MKVKTSELSGDSLDWAIEVIESGERAKRLNYPSPYSTEWEYGGPIIERVGMHLIYLGFGGEEEWEAYILSDSKFIGQTPLIAAMRCYVASKLGNEVEIETEGETNE